MHTHQYWKVEKAFAIGSNPQYAGVVVPAFLVNSQKQDTYERLLTTNDYSLIKKLMSFYADISSKNFSCFPPLVTRIMMGNLELWWDVLNFTGDLNQN